MTINRRALLAGLTAAAAARTARLARAQSWKGQYPELVYAVVPAENASGVTERYAIVSGQGRMEVGDLPPMDVGPGDTVFIPAGEPQWVRGLDFDVWMRITAWTTIEPMSGFDERLGLGSSVNITCKAEFNPISENRRNCWSLELR